MAGNKPAARHWNDVQVAIATISMVATLGYWNLFAGPDRASALKHAKEQAAPDPLPATDAVLVPTATPKDGKIYFGGTEPQLVIVVQQQRKNGVGGGGGGGGGGGEGDGPVAAPPAASSGGGGGGGTGGS